LPRWPNPTRTHLWRGTQDPDRFPTDDSFGGHPPASFLQALPLLRSCQGSLRVVPGRVSFQAHPGNRGRPLSFRRAGKRANAIRPHSTKRERALRDHPQRPSISPTVPGATRWRVGELTRSPSFDLAALLLGRPACTGLATGRGATHHAEPGVGRRFGRAQIFKQPGSFCLGQRLVA
jgi:hypothetical protein